MNYKNISIIQNPNDVYLYTITVNLMETRTDIHDELWNGDEKKIIPLPEINSSLTLKITSDSSLKQRSKFDKSGSVYPALLNNLMSQKNKNNSVTLNIHIPGTGCRHNDNLPTYAALQQLAHIQKQSGIKPAMLMFEGTGASTEEHFDYLPPSLYAANSLEKKLKETPTFYMFAASAAQDIDLLVQSEFTALLLGVVAGAGKNTNNYRVMGALEALEEDDAFPDVIFLSGHSRGAINCISLANDIYDKYQDRIKIHLLLTDPVPGPGYGNVQDTLLIPANVISFTCFYAADEERLFFIAHDHNRLKFANPQTTITSYPLDGDHNSFFHAMRKYQDYLTGIVCAINGVKPADCKIGYGKADKSLNVKGKGYREGSVYHLVTEINSECNTDLATVLNQLRTDIGDNNFSMELTKNFREKMPQIIEEIKKKVCSNLNYALEFADRNYRMISDTLEKIIADDISEILETVLPVLAPIEKSILLSNEKLINEIAGESGIKITGLTDVYFNNLNKKEMNMLISGLLHSAGINTKSDKVNCVANSLFSDKEKRKKEVIVSLYLMIAKHVTQEELGILIKESQNKVSPRMRLLRYERPLIEVGGKKITYGDTNSYKHYCKSLKILESRLKPNTAAFYQGATTSTTSTTTTSSTHSTINSRQSSNRK